MDNQERKQKIRRWLETLKSGEYNHPTHVSDTTGRMFITSIYQDEMIKKERTMLSEGITGATDIADLILDVLQLNKNSGGEVVSLDLLGMDGVAVELDNGRKYEIRVNRTNPSDVE